MKYVYILKTLEYYKKKDRRDWFCVGPTINFHPTLTFLIYQKMETFLEIMLLLSLLSFHGVCH